MERKLELTPAKCHGNDLRVFFTKAEKAEGLSALPSIPQTGSEVEWCLSQSV